MTYNPGQSADAELYADDSEFMIHHFFFWNFFARSYSLHGGPRRPVLLESQCTDEDVQNSSAAGLERTRVLDNISRLFRTDGTQ